MCFESVWMDETRNQNGNQMKYQTYKLDTQMIAEKLHIPSNSQIKYK